MKQKFAAISACFSLLLTCLPAYAHTGEGIKEGYLNGMLHPLLGIDHVLVMMGVGLWGTVLGGNLRWQLPAVFLVMMTAGAGLGFSDVSVQAAEMGVAFSVMALALILASERRVPTGLALAMAGAFALSHGYVHAKEMESGMDALLYALGFLMSTAFLVAMGSACCLLSPSAVRNLRDVYALICTFVGVAIVSGI